MSGQSPEVDKITTPVTPLGLTDKINEVIDALAAIQISAAAARAIWSGNWMPWAGKWGKILIKPLSSPAC